MKTTIPNRPAISNVLIKASANGAFRARLLDSPKEALVGLNVPPEDAEILEVHAPNLKEYAYAVKLRLMN